MKRISKFAHCLLLAAVTAIAPTASANAEDDPDILRYPAPKLHPQTTGCVTVHGKSTITDWPYSSRICIGDTARAQDIGCPSVAAIFHTGKGFEDTLEDMKRRERKFGCKDIDGLKLRVIEIYQESDTDGYACGVDYNHNKWCLIVEGFEGTTITTMPNGGILRR
jgi:hypothetical protein